jgi:hypothetical protein
MTGATSAHRSRGHRTPLWDPHRDPAGARKRYWHGDVSGLLARDAQRDQLRRGSHSDTERPHEPIRWAGARRHCVTGARGACPDCRCPLGGVHHRGCDMEVCPLCHHQAIICGCQDSDEHCLVRRPNQSVTGQTGCISTSERPTTQPASGHHSDISTIGWTLPRSTSNSTSLL